MHLPRVHAAAVAAAPAGLVHAVGAAGRPRLVPEHGLLHVGEREVLPQVGRGRRRLRLVPLLVLQVERWSCAASTHPRRRRPSPPHGRALDANGVAAAAAPVARRRRRRRRAAAAAALSSRRFPSCWRRRATAERALRRGARCAGRLRRHARRRPRDDRRRAGRRRLLRKSWRVLRPAAMQRSRRGGRDPRVGDWAARRTLNLFETVASVRGNPSRGTVERLALAPRAPENKRVVWCGKSGRACGDGKEYGSGRGVRHVDREKEAR